MMVRIQKLLDMLDFFHKWEMEFNTSKEKMEIFVELPD